MLVLLRCSTFRFRARCTSSLKPQTPGTFAALCTCSFNIWTSLLKCGAWTGNFLWLYLRGSDGTSQRNVIGSITVDLRFGLGTPAELDTTASDLDVVCKFPEKIGGLQPHKIELQIRIAVKKNSEGKLPNGTNPRGRILTK